MHEPQVQSPAGPNRQTIHQEDFSAGVSLKR